jgi:hypothetical protein
LIPLTQEEKNAINLGTWSNGWLIQLLELMAVWFGLRSFAGALRGRAVKLRIDSTTALSYVIKGCGWEPVKSCVAKMIVQWAAENDVIIWSPEYITTKDNQADDPSRRVDQGDWTVQHWVFAECQQKWGPHSVDRFAAWENAKLPRFNSQWLCPGVEAVDAFTQDWRGENNWVAVAFDQIMAVLLHVKECQAKATLVIPIWTGQPWWPVLQKMAVDWWEIPQQRRGAHTVQKGSVRNSGTMGEPGVAVCGGENRDLKRRRSSSATAAENRKRPSKKSKETRGTRRKEGQ